MTSASEGFTRPEGARNTQMERKMREDNRAGRCPFCHLPPDREILLETEHWLVAPNASPMPGTDHSLLVISKHHTVRIEELPLAALHQLAVVVRDVVEMRDITSFVLLSRMGDPRFNSATVYHLHLQINSSNRRPISSDDIPAQDRHIIAGLLERFSLENIGDPLERLDELRQSIDVTRAMMQDKAHPLRYKGSNQIDRSQE